MMRYFVFRSLYFQCVGLKRILKKVALSVALLNGAFAFSSGLFVGNGGEGVWVNGRLILRDLHEYGVGRGPVVGSDVDSRLSVKLGDGPLDLSIETKDILLRKLTDLNRLSPALGYYLIEVLNYYRWTFVMEPLNPFPETGSAVQGEKIVPLANRFRATIRIQQQMWPLLSPENQAALLIHEAASSLLLPDCAGNYCVQDPFKVREMVGLMFAGNHGERYRMTPAMERSLAIPPARLRQELKHGEAYVKVGDALTMSYQPFAWTEMAVLACQTFSTEGFAWIEMGRDPFQIREQVYETRRDRSVYAQMHLSFEPVSPIQRLYSSVGGGTCQATLERELRDWFDVNPKAIHNEKLGTLVERFYVHVLGRASDPEGKEFWYNEIYGWRELDQNFEQRFLRFKSVVRTFFGSSEFLARDLDSVGFVQAVYAVTLNHPPDTDGLDYWVAQLESGMETRAQVLEHFLNHRETRSRAADIF